MSNYVRIAVTFLDPMFHGRGDGGEPEWPPSPLRLMQAIVAANAGEIGTGGDLDGALAWLEAQDAPLIVAPHGQRAEPYQLSVPNNAMDIVGNAWAKGKYFGGGDSNPATHRTMKPIRPVRMSEGDTVHYLWNVDRFTPAGSVPIEPLTKAARRIVALGWGVDLVVGCAQPTSSAELHELPGDRWLPMTSSSSSSNHTPLRTPVRGTLAALQQRHDAFLHRVGPLGFVPVEPLTQFAITPYQGPSDIIERPHSVFELRHDDGSFCSYPQRKLMHIAGMMRHLAKAAMLRSLPRGAGEDWVERYVVGHRSKTAEAHRQFSYLPLPSIGHEYADHAVRRVMIAAPAGDDELLKHLSARLEGLRLKPERGDEFGEQGPPTLIRVNRDNVVQRYTAAANRWVSVTPVILPGHDDRKPAKTRKLIDTALAQSGIDGACTYEWSAVSRFRNSLSAHKFDRNERPVYLKPRYLQHLSAVHLTLTFQDNMKIPGPLVVGAGRHIGFGVMAQFAT